MPRDNFLKSINGANQDGSLPIYAEECPGIMATAYSRELDTFNGIVKVVGKTKFIKILL